MIKKVSLKKRIYNYLKRNSETYPGKWLNGMDIETMALLAGHKGSNASRRLRELAEENIIEREVRSVKGRVPSVWYRYISKPIIKSTQKLW